MEIIAEIRRRHLVSGESLSAIAADLKLSRTTVRKYLKTTEEPNYQRQHQPAPKLGAYKARLEQWLVYDATQPKKLRRTARRLYEGLCEEGYRGAYDSVQRFVKRWNTDHRKAPAATQAFIPLMFQPGEVCQFDWSEEYATIGGVNLTIKVAHFRLAYSRKMFVVAYPRESQEMVFDAHDRAFAFFGGVPKQMVYDNLTTVVESVLTGKERQFNRRFLTLSNYYLFEPVACTPAAGWEKGQVENQVGNIREWLFTPRIRFDHFADLNEWLAKRCEELAQRAHPTQSERTIADCFSEEQPGLRAITRPFDGYVESSTRVSKYALVRADHNHYSVPAEWVGEPVSLRKNATSITVVAKGKVVARHERVFGRGTTRYDPWHYLSVLEKKPGALRHGAPFQQWALPEAVQQVRQRLVKQIHGDRAFVELLLLTREVGIETLEVACDLALQRGSVQVNVILNEMRRLAEPVRAKSLDQTLDDPVTQPPLADCYRYDHLLGVHNVH
jgi:transposase